MAPDDRIQLLLTADAVERYCASVPRTARGMAHALSSLVAVQTFLGAVSGPDVQAANGYRAVRQVLSDHIGALQTRLLAESAAHLRPALLDRNVAGLTRLHASLSRSGFREALLTALQGLGNEEMDRVRQWVHQWCREARDRAEAASGYPDALDFAAAGIALESFAALSDVDKTLSQNDL